MNRYMIHAGSIVVQWSNHIMIMFLGSRLEIYGIDILHDCYYTSFYKYTCSLQTIGPLTKKHVMNTSCWLNQPIWKICSSNWIISPIFGMKTQNSPNHQLAIILFNDEFPIENGDIPASYVSLLRRCLFLPQPKAHGSQFRLDGICHVAPLRSKCHAVHLMAKFWCVSAAGKMAWCGGDWWRISKTTPNNTKKSWFWAFSRVLMFMRDRIDACNWLKPLHWTWVSENSSLK